MESFELRTTQREVIMDITSEIAATVRKSGIKDGLCMVFIPHTTAGVTINENADPDVKTDVRNSLQKLIPESNNYLHAEGNADSHVKATLTGSSVLLAIESGKLQLGTWQGIQFCEFDGPRNRKVWIKLINSAAGV